MIFLLLAGALGLKALAHATGYDAEVGVQCKLCGWKYHVGESYAYSTAAKAEADRVFRLHVLDKHPNLLKEQK